MRARVLVLGLVLTIAVLPGGLPTLAGPSTPTPYPSEEEVARHGFAIWPEDTVQEAQQACGEHADDQPWRLSAEETAVKFAKRILSHRNPVVDDEMSDFEDDHARLWLYADEVFLSNIVELRRAGVCWYITFGEPRESGYVIPPVFTQEAQGVRVYFDSSRGPNGFGQIGFGQHSETYKPGEGPSIRSSLLPDEVLDDEGHVLYLGWDRNSAETVDGDKLPPPPEIGAGEEIFPVGERFSWEDTPRDGRTIRCRRSLWSASSPRAVLNSVLQWEFGRATPSGPYPDVWKVGRRGWIGKRIYISRLDKETWNLRIDDVPYRFVAEQATENCSALSLLRPREKKRPLEEAFWNDTGTTVDFLWQNAGRADLSVSHRGNDAGALMHDVAPSQGTFYRSQYRERSQRPGLIFVILSEKGRYVNAYARRLPPPDTP
jgi:hypothetical protein